MPRNLVAALGPPIFGAAESALGKPGSAVASAAVEHPAMDRRARLAVFGMGIAGVLPPLAFTARPGDLGLIAGMPVSIALTGMLILAPALVGLVAALAGLDSVRESFRARGDSEHEQAVLRVFVAGLAVAYGFVMASYPGNGDEAAACQVVPALGLAGGWLLLLLSLIDAVPSVVRHYLGTLFDAVLVSAFLHYGGALAAPWLPLYLIAAFYAGFRFGPVALAGVALANLAGFTAVVATTPFWREQGLLAGGFVAAMILLPAYVGRMVRDAMASREAAAAAQAARTRFLMVVNQALRAPLDALLGDKAERPEAPAAAPTARALLSQLSSVLDFSAIEAGAFEPPVEAFDLHRLVNATMEERRAEATARGLRLRINIDPALPYRLRGWAQQLAQILDYIVARALAVSKAGTVRVAIGAGGLAGRQVHLRIAVQDEGEPIAAAEADAIFDPFAPRQARSAHGAFGLAVVKRLVELMGGRIAVEGGASRGSTLRVTVPIALDDLAADNDLDLQRCLVLIATDDSQFASELAEPLNAWHGDPHWIEGFDGTLGFLEGRGGACSVLIVDGRRHALAALSFAHRAASGAEPPSFVLAVAEPAQIDGLLDLADGAIDAVLAAPLDIALFASALHSLPLWRGGAPRPVMVPAAEPPAEFPAEFVAALAAASPPADGPPPPPEVALAEPQVTPISAHPRFAGETPIVDPRAVAALRGLGEGDFFLGEVVDSFRTDAKEIMHRIVRSAAAADAASFARGLHALRSCAGNLGGMRLCETLLSMREVGEQELREQGSVLVQRLGDELARLDAALAEYLPRGTRREA